VTDAYGVVSNINYFETQFPVVTYAITISPLAGFTSDILAQIQTSLANWTNARGIGVGIQYNRAYAAAYLFGVANGQTYEITSMAVARDGNTPTSADVRIAFDEAASCVAADVSITVSP
jgi:hypothetical protein